MEIMSNTDHFKTSRKRNKNGIKPTLFTYFYGFPEDRGGKKDRPQHVGALNAIRFNVQLKYAVAAEGESLARV